jgi:glycine/D-amino acid oxidase-like deaminating enzyme
VHTGEVGFWWRALGGAIPTRPPLEGDAEADVAIVGAGYTGLWTAYYLARADPSLRIVVLEAESVGFGASGRNGGWVSGFFSGPDRVYERGAGGREALIELKHEMFATVREVGRVAAEEQIECDFVQDGQIAVALDSAQALRLRERVIGAHAGGLGEEDVRELDAAELDQRLRVSGASAASFTPHVARIQPALLVDGLARAVERHGVSIPCREDSDGDGQGALDRPGDRGLHGLAAWLPATAPPAQQLDDHHRAAASRRVAPDRLAGQRAACG